MELKRLHFSSSCRIPWGDFFGRNGILVPRTELGHLDPCLPFWTLPALPDLAQARPRSF